MNERGIYRIKWDVVPSQMRSEEWVLGREKMVEREDDNNRGKGCNINSVRS